MSEINSVAPGISREMLRKGAAAMWGSTERDAMKTAQIVLEAALAGRTVVDLPEPDARDAGDWATVPHASWWPKDAHKVRAFLVDGTGQIGSAGKPYVRVENSSGSVVFDATDAADIAAAILAAGPAADRLASGFPESGEPT